MIYFYKTTILIFYLYEYYYINKYIKKILLSEKHAEHATNLHNINERYSKENDAYEKLVQYLTKLISEDLEEIDSSKVDECKFENVEGNFEDESGEKKSIRKHKIFLEQEEKKEQEKKEQLPLETSLVSKNELEEFEKITKGINIMNVDFSRINKLLGLGISRNVDVQVLNDEFPLYLGPKINFKDITKPFGATFPILKDAIESDLHNTLFFDNFLTIDIYEFINKTYVGNLTLEKAYFSFILKDIRYVQYSEKVLEFLNSSCGLYNTLLNIPIFISVYLKNKEPEICIFFDEHFSKIRQNVETNTKFVENVIKSINYRYLTKDEKIRLGKIIANTKKYEHYLSTTINYFKVKIDTITEGIYFVEKITPNNKMLNRDNILISCIYFVLSYCIKFATPLYEKIINRGEYSRSEFFFVSSNLNNLINILEFLQHNSKLYNDFYENFENLDKHYPRVKSEDTFLNFYDFIMLKIHIIGIIYNICKISLKIVHCNQVKENYIKWKSHSYYKLLHDSRYIIQISSELLKKNL
ncbi:conserved Plasmodium protein, unknown function [Plasmodium relictum]|uniref:KELT protein n=1 Tax=Plasmodium relictum TaxID=85471 RepID=A0A1J1GK16_PLARL|nr:conserved Plasmodium protein, unknown function [Plasmodium relictum]CRG84539.1 conserved Plasmodium protein, unknown function [Plasmodium relictum]